MAKKEAPTKLTGGAGFRYEDHIAARFLIDFLAASNSLGHGFGRIHRIDWQARDAGWHADDLAITYLSADQEGAAGLSIKSDRQVTSSGFPATFVEAAWEHWFGVGTARRLRERQDALVLVVGKLAGSIQEAWDKTLREALETAPERMLARLSAPGSDGGRSQSSKLQRSLFASLRCPEHLKANGDGDGLATVQLIRHIRLLNYDYESPTSQDIVTAINDCQLLVKRGDLDSGNRLWRRLLDFATEQRTAGGSTDLPKLLDALRGEFVLVDHPDYRADWQALDRLSREALDDVRTTIPGIDAFSRTEELASIEQKLSGIGLCIVAGESGSGKSALAKLTAQGSYEHVFWPTAEALDVTETTQLQLSLSLQHSPADVIMASSGRCLVVLDALEGYSAKALRQAARLVQAIAQRSSARDVHIILTVQIEAASRIAAGLVEHGVERRLLVVLEIGRPAEELVERAIAFLPSLTWAMLRPEFRTLLTNLKILEWVVQASQTGQPFDTTAIVSLTALIERLWERWVEGEEGDLARSGLLMRLGILEAQTLTSGVPRVSLEYAEQQALPRLIASDLVCLRRERVRFTHDLLGDWARMRVLVGDDPTAAGENRQRAALPRWNRAMRLYGQTLLEEGAQGLSRWEQALSRLDDGSDASTIVRDLLLEAVFLTANAQGSIGRAWPVLAHNDGKLLNRLLDRFLFVSTLPNPRLTEFFGSGAAAVRFEHLYRIPFGPYWGPVLLALHAQRPEVSRLAPSPAAQIARLWLRLTPATFDSGRIFAWRREAAELALAVAREYQAQREEGSVFANYEDQAAFEAALYAAPDLPDEVSTLCLELARRRGPSGELQARIERARARAEEERTRECEADPDRIRQIKGLCTPILFGLLRAPWADGPSERVCDSFRQACLNSGAFISLIRSKPLVALEVLLAVCIEEPQHDNSHGHASREDCGVEHWFEGYPPLYIRGPFLTFLREAPEDGLSFVLRLINFATRRWAETEPRRLAWLGLESQGTMPGVDILLDGRVRRWVGNICVFRWNHDWPHECTVITCALMALEKWLYEGLELGKDLAWAFSRILSESESIAFAGLLVDVAKCKPDLLVGPLKPLLSAWELINHDLQVTVERSGSNAGLIGWRMQPASEFRTQAYEWFGRPHRQRMLRDIVVGLYLSREDLRPFFAEVRANWIARLQDGGPEALRLLTERLNLDNYTLRTLDDGRTEFTLHWPEEIERQLAEGGPQRDARTQVLFFPWHCRQRLEAGTPLTEAELSIFWETLLEIDQQEGQSDSEEDAGPMHVEDAICGGIAVLLLLHGDWVVDEAKRLAWCRDRLEEIVNAPPPLSRFAVDSALGNHQWDAFAAECGVYLLVRDQGDELARRLVASGVMAFRHATAALAMKRASQHRDRLGSDFSRLMTLAVRWSVIRALLEWCANTQMEGERWQQQASQLITSFVDGSISSELPSLFEANAVARVEIEELLQGRHQERDFSSTNRPETQEHVDRKRARDPALDPAVVQSAFCWIDLSTACCPEERVQWLGIVRQLLMICLDGVPLIDDPDEQDIDGLPCTFDHWVFSLIARTLPHMTPQEEPASLWKSILALPVAAHHWVESFFWEWFTLGVQAALDFEQFTAIWSEMIQYAVLAPHWLPAGRGYHNLIGMVCELLGFHFGADTFAPDARFASGIVKMRDLFERAARKWLGMPRVASGLARFMTQPAATCLLLPGLCWLDEAIESFDEYDWQERELEDRLVDVLRACWERHRTEVSQDPNIRGAFQALLRRLTSRGGHAVAALRDRLLDSISHHD